MGSFLPLKMASNTFSKADILCRRIIRNTFFSKGWGSLDMYRNMKRLKRDLFDAEKFKEMVSVSESVKIDKVSKVKSKHESYSIVDGHFVSPLVKYYPGLLPKESEVAQFQAIVPSNRGEKPAMCVQLAGTGDHGYWRRRNLIAKPLLRENSIGSIMLVNPYYGSRKPKTQTRSSLNYVVDLFVMGCALIAETSVLLNWCEYQDFGPLAVMGVSMGGHMASLAVTFVPKPVVVVPCLSWTTASSVFTQGVLSKAVAWPILEQQLEDEHFVEELRDICHMVEMDGIFSRNPPIVNTKTHSYSSFPNELLNFNSDTEDPGVDFHMNVSNKTRMSENCESVSVGMLAGSLKEQFGNDIKHKIPTEIPFLKSGKQKNQKYEKARKFMKYIMDITTHLAYYKEPVDPKLAMFIEAQYDGYIPRKDCPSPLELWPGCQVKYTQGGHVFAALYKQNVFRRTMAETLKKL